MGRVSPIQNSFVGGILSERMRGRSDTEKYHASADDLLNMTVSPHGGVFRRPGTYMIEPAKYDDKISRLVEFEFNTEQAYIIEMGEYYLRFFHRTGGVIIDSVDYVVNGTFDANIAGWTDKSTGTGSIAWDGVGAMALTADVSGSNTAIAEQAITFPTKDCKILVGFDCENEVEIIVGSASGASDLYNSGPLLAGAHAIEFINTGAKTVYLQFKWLGGAGSRDVDNVTVYRDVYEIETVYTEAEIDSVQYAQSADVMYMVHPSHPPKLLSRYGDDNWTFLSAAFTEGPYRQTNYTRAHLLTISGAGYLKGDVVTCAATAHAPFTAAMVGDPIRLESEADNTKYAWGIITAYTSTSSVSVTLGADAPAELQNIATFRWNMAAFTAALGFPSCVNLAAQRVFFGRTAAYPQTFWGSEPAILDTFSLGINGNNGIMFTLASRKPHSIQWIAAAGKGLLVGTQGGEWTIGGGGDNVITPSTMHVDPETSRGNSSIQPVEAGRAVLAIDRFGHKLREIKYNFEADGFNSIDLTIMADHLGRESNFYDMAYQPDDNSIIWVIRSDGQMAACTYEPDHNVLAWHRHTTRGSFEAAAAIPGVIEDDAWVIVRRSIGGVSRRFIEQIQPSTQNPVEGAFYVDCGLSYIAEHLPVTAASQAAACVVRVDCTLLEVAPKVGDALTFSDVEGMVELNDNKYDISAVALVAGMVYDVTLNVDSLEFGAYSAGGTARYGPKTVTGLGHLNGESVDVLADGAPISGVAVSGGSISISRGAATIHIGSGFQSTIAMLPPDAGGQNGTSLAKAKRYNSLSVYFYKTVGAKINGEVVIFQTINQPMGKPVPVFTGFKSVENFGWDEEQKVVISQEQPLPMNVLMVTGTLTTNDG